MRAAALLLLAAAPAFAGGEVDLTPTSRRGDKPPTWVVRAEAGSPFAPYGYAGACLSWLAEERFELEAGAGGGFPGLQLGLATRSLFGERGSYFLFELAIAGNTKVNRGFNEQDRFLNPTAANSSLWGAFGVGFEQRQGYFSLSVVGSIVSTFSNPSVNWAVHGGVGVGF